MAVLISVFLFALMVLPNATIQIEKFEDVEVNVPVNSSEEDAQLFGMLNQVGNQVVFESQKNQDEKKELEEAENDNENTEQIANIEAFTDGNIQQYQYL